MDPNDYELIEKIYGNYRMFQSKIAPIISSHKTGRKISVLEIGCGTGISTEIILSSRKDMELISIDLDRHMMDFAKEKLFNFKNVTFEEKDACRFLAAQKSGSFDIVVSAFTIHNMDESYRRELYSHVLSVLKNSGVFINADKFVGKTIDAQVQGLKYRISSYIEVLIRERKYDLLAEWAVHYIDDQRPGKILEFDANHEVLKETGFASAYYLFKSELEMLGICLARKNNL